MGQLSHTCINAWQANCIRKLPNWSHCKLPMPIIFSGENQKTQLLLSRLRRLKQQHTIHWNHSYQHTTKHCNTTSLLQHHTSPKRHGVTIKTVDKWIADNDKTLNTMTWLKYNKADCEQVATLKCSACFRFDDKLCSVRNYDLAYVVGSTNLCTSTFKERVASDIHQRAMVLLNKSQGSAVVEYAPIAMMLTILNEDAERKLKRKFEIAYFICK